MSNRSLLCICALILFACEQVEAKDWRGIVPLLSTRADVERILGTPTNQSNEQSSVYKLEKETVLIFYASGPPCRDDMLSGWQVPRGTVVSITVSPTTKVHLSDLQVDLSKYKKRTDFHRRDNINYVNEEEGESFNVFLDEVTYFTFFPAAKDKHLSCPPSRVKQRRSNRSRLHAAEPKIVPSH
jgi:hypothetical protein